MEAVLRLLRTQEELGAELLGALWRMSGPGSGVEIALARRAECGMALLAELSLSELPAVRVAALLHPRHCPRQAALRLGEEREPFVLNEVLRSQAAAELIRAAGERTCELLSAADMRGAVLAGELGEGVACALNQAALPEQLRLELTRKSLLVLERWLSHDGESSRTSPQGEPLLGSLAEGLNDLVGAAIGALVNSSGESRERIRGMFFELTSPRLLIKAASRSRDSLLLAHALEMALPYQEIQGRTLSREHGERIWELTQRLERAQLGAIEKLLRDSELRGCPYESYLRQWLLRGEQEQRESQGRADPFERVESLTLEQLRALLVAHEGKLPHTVLARVLSWRECPLPAAELGETAVRSHHLGGKDALVMVREWDRDYVREVLRRSPALLDQLDWEPERMSRSGGELAADLWRERTPGAPSCAERLERCRVLGHIQLGHARELPWALVLECLGRDADFDAEVIAQIRRATTTSGGAGVFAALNAEGFGGSLGELLGACAAGV